MVELLLKNKSPINATDVAGQTPLHHAIAEGHGMFVLWILIFGWYLDGADKKQVTRPLRCWKLERKQTRKTLMDVWRWIWHPTHR
jgi:ankyrin repeat protein